MPQEDPHRIPPEATNSSTSTDAMVQLENALKLEKQRNESLLKEKRVVDHQVRAHEKEIERLNALVDQIKSETGWANERSGGTRSPTNSSSQENRIGELMATIKRLEEELKTDRQIQRKKTQLIESLTLELDHKKKVEEELFEAKNLIKVREREIKEAGEKLRALERTYAKKDKLITQMENDKGEGLVKTLESDKKYLQSENAKLNESRRQIERTVKAQQQKIDTLEARLATINVALKDTKRDKAVAEVLRSAENSVNASTIGAVAADIDATPRPHTMNDENSGENVLDLLRLDVQRLRNALRTKDVLMHEKDQIIESLQRKVDVLSHAKRTEVRQASAGKKGLSTQIEEMKKAMQAQEEQFKEGMDRAKAENLRLKSKLREVSEV